RLLVMFFALALAGAASAGEWQIETVDSEGDVGKYTSLALESSGRPHISYYGDGHLKYASWNGSSWWIETVDSVGDVCEYTSLALDDSDYPHISYGGDGALKYARWNGSSWQIQTVDSDGDVGAYSSLALDDSDYPHISYYYASYDSINDVRFSPRDDYEAPVLITPDRYSRGYLKYAHWNGSSWQIQTVDSTSPDVGMWTSLALDFSDRPNISYNLLYWDEYELRRGALRYARWNGSSWQTYAVDMAGEVGEFTSLALDSDGNPRVSYYDVKHTSLKYAHWEGGPGVEDAELSANTCDEGVLVGWTITGDVPASFTVLRSVGESEPTTVSGALPGTAVRWLDTKAEAGVEYCYWLEAVEEDGTVSRFGPTETVTFPGAAREIDLAVYPSPASGSFTIDYTLPGDGRVSISLYDLSGRRIATVLDGEMTAGRHDFSYDASALPPGVYLVRLATDSGSLTRRVVVAR
ncbi:MAG: T9SS type A sorting domain-containing protein, partial [bacterium]|nr:T9SS type A sorting domain-containing protein [bacterium]